VTQSGVQTHLEWADNTAPSSTGQWLYSVSYASTNSDPSHYCVNNDALCKTVMSRSLCSKFTTYATAAGTTRNILQSIRHEIFYKIHTTCATKQQLYDAAPVVKQLRDALQVQLIFHYLALILGSILTLAKIGRDYVGMDDFSEHDDREQVQYARVNYGFDVVMKIAKLSTIIVSVIAVGKAGDAFQNAAACTDKTSASQGFVTLDETIKEIAANTVTNIVLEVLVGLFLAFNAISTLFQRWLNAG
jgi:hypothetical protein